MKKLMMLAAVAMMACACTAGAQTTQTTPTLAAPTEVYLPALQIEGKFSFGVNPIGHAAFQIDSTRYPVGAKLEVAPFSLNGSSSAFRVRTSAPNGTIVTVCVGIYDGVSGPLVGTETCTDTSPVSGNDPALGIIGTLPEMLIAPAPLLTGAHQYLIGLRATAPAGTTVRPDVGQTDWTRIRWYVVTVNQMLRLCTFPGCDRPHKAKSLCQGHYNQQRHGEVLRPHRPPRGVCT